MESLVTIDAEELLMSEASASATLAELGAQFLALLEAVDAGDRNAVLPAYVRKVRWPSRRRPHVPSELRLAVYERDGWLCVRCGSGDDLSLDHVNPYKNGGPDTYENLQTMCMPCNRKKGARQ